MRRCIAVGWAAMLPLAGLAASGAGGIEACEARVSAQPQAAEAWDCWIELSRSVHADELLARLKPLADRDPDNPFPRRAYGEVGARRLKKFAIEELKTAARMFSDRGMVEHELDTWILLAELYSKRLLLDDARDTLDRAAALAAEVGGRLPALRVDVERARLAYNGSDFGGTWRLTRRIELDDAFDELPGHDRHQILYLQGSAAELLGLLEPAAAAFRREVAMPDSPDYASHGALVDLARVTRLLAEHGQTMPEGHDAMIRDALTQARDTANIFVQLEVDLELAELQAPATAFDNLRSLVDQSRRWQCHDVTVRALSKMGYLLLRENPGDPSEGLGYLDQAVSEARATGDVMLQSNAEARRARNLASIGAREEAIRAGIAGLDTIEKLRDLQSDEQARSRRIGQFAASYRRPATLLLAADGGPSTEELQLALQIIERLRSRTLLEQLDLARATERVGRRGDSWQQRERLLARIAEIQRRLAGFGVTADERAGWLRELEQLEIEELGLRDRIAREDPAFAALRKPEPPTLTEVERRLAPGAALVSFVLPADPAGSLWTTVHTGGGSRAVELGAVDRLESRIRFLSALIERRDGSEALTASALYEDLIAPVLRELPAEVDSLVVVPDGMLHRLPFSALRPDPDLPPLGVSHRLSIAPSVSLWLRWRGADLAAAEGSVLALVDPELPDAGSADAVERGAVLAEALALGPLPWARAEGRSIMRAAGGRGRLLVGADASEPAIKQASLTDFGLVHFAAHAIVDGINPDRSAVLLSAGDVDQDGLLQIREIVNLDLTGRVVVLAACRSASGEVVGGEGMLSLARAFFQAGAHAVVASLWPLRDEDSAALFPTFYRALARGSSVSAALQAARRDAVERAVPTSAWAGLVVLGNGDHVPFPGGLSKRGIGPASVATVVALVVAGWWLIALRHRRS